MLLSELIGICNKIINEFGDVDVIFPVGEDDWAEVSFMGLDEFEINDEPQALWFAYIDVAPLQGAPELVLMQGGLDAKSNPAKGNRATASKNAGKVV